MCRLTGGIPPQMQLEQRGLDPLANGSSLEMMRTETCFSCRSVLVECGLLSSPTSIPLPHMVSITACIEAANISCVSSFLYWALEIYFSNLWENYYVPCWENCVYGSCRETSLSVPVHNSFAGSSFSFCILEQYHRNLLPPLGWAWVSPVFEIRSICSAVCMFQCCPQSNHWVWAEHNNTYSVPQIFGFGCAAALLLENSIVCHCW